VRSTKITSGSTSIPTDTRKVGMKKALPKKSVIDIRGLSLGTTALRPAPTKKTPISTEAAKSMSNARAARVPSTNGIKAVSRPNPKDTRR
jgi:hypothetical protein